MSRAAVLRHIDEHIPETIALSQELLRIPSVNPPGNEGPVAELVVQKLRPLGFEIERIEVEAGRPNILARLAGKTGSPRLVCYAHFDVVPPGAREDWIVDPFSGAQIEDRIYGRGAIDHKSPIAALWAAVRALRETGIDLRGDLLFTFVADEENLGEKGMQYIAGRRLVSADVGIYCTHTAVKDEGARRQTPWMGQDNILIAHNGKAHLRVLIEGRVAHTMSLELGLNAIEKAGPVITALSALAAQVSRREHPLTGRARMSLNLIRGGQKDNVVPDRCVIDIDRRYTPAESTEAVLREVDAALGPLRTQDPALKVRVEVVRDDEPSQISPDHPLVHMLRATYEEATDRTPAVTGTCATADAKWFINHLGVPMAMVGCGDLYRAHRANEYVTVGELSETAKVYALSIMDVLGA